LTDFRNFFTAIYNNELRNKNLLKFSRAMKKLQKSVNICQSYHKNKRVSFFMAHSVYTYVMEKITYAYGKNAIKF